MREALSWFTFDVPDPAAEPYSFARWTREANGEIVRTHAEAL